MALDTTKLSDEQFIFAYVLDHAAEELTETDMARYDAIAKKDTQKELLESYHTSLGQLQLQMQGYYVGGEQLTELHDLIETPDLRKTHELQQIEKMGRQEFYANIRRRLVLVLFILGLGYFGYGYVKPAEIPAFSPLELVTYEAVAMMEEPMQRLALTTNDDLEIKEYLSNDPQIKFDPVNLNPGSSEWIAQGASIIDYDTLHMAVTEYHLSAGNETVFLFQAEGNLKSLPAAEPGNFDGLIYQAYESEFFNVIAWNAPGDSIGYLVGRMSAPDLAKLARTTQSP